MEVSARICEGTTHPAKVGTLQHVLHNKCSQQVLRNRCCATGAAQQVPLQWRRDAPERHRVSRPRPPRPPQGFAPSGQDQGLRSHPAPRRLLLGRGMRRRGAAGMASYNGTYVYTWYKCV